ncbi:FAD dependent oxidoreductase [Penicillium taxi]|uniref:FAD dependent oxidoreductase n=1 Tax=Penicillium taxi TaxID=168475 RepID=UPI00254543D2|nr:FAD dependent oxidoreductase [Penicillium taxi]KAJ5888099.1 FAD dependent oxidoreductase [Penicillium taxi]
MALPPKILIVGGGVFGLSTALSLRKRHPTSHITLIESSLTIPNPHGSSVDTSRIVRADYANAAYTKLAAAAIKKWRHTPWGAEGRYTQNGLLLVYPASSASAKGYARKSYDNVRKVEEDRDQVVFLHTQEDVQSVVPPYDNVDVAGGYVNWGSGWADAGGSVLFAKKMLDREGGVKFLTGDVSRVMYGDCDVGSKRRATGVELADGSSVTADLVILATGAWTPALVDLRGKAVATGQAIAYIQISDAEQAELENLPTILNFATGIFIIPPRDNLLKIARHAFGYRNPVTIPVPVPGPAAAGKVMQVSLPETGMPIPLEGEEALRVALKQLLPRFVDRPFAQTRICWYTDTPNGDFIISYHPEYEGLFVATGGSGHGFKFFPVIGDKIVDALEGSLEPELQKLWEWTEVSSTDSEDIFDGDGSRSGARNSILKDELAKTRKAARGSAL